MLMPNRTKYRRPHRVSYEGKTKAGRKVSFGEYGLQAEEGGYVSSRQIEAARVAMTLYEAWRSGLDQNLPAHGKNKETSRSSYGFR